jgi:hypothetical protein
VLANYEVIVEVSVAVCLSRRSASVDPAAPSPPRLFEESESESESLAIIATREHFTGCRVSLSLTALSASCGPWKVYNLGPALPQLWVAPSVKRKGSGDA